MTDSVILEQKTRAADHDISKHLTRQRLYIFPTQNGMVFSVMLVVMLMGAINYTNSMAYMLTFLLVSLFLVCMLHTYRNLRGLVVSINNADPVFAGEAAQFPVLFENRNGPDRHSINIHPRPKGFRLRSDNTLGIEDVRVGSGELLRDSLPVLTKERGIMKPGRVRIHSRFPLGLLQAWSYMECLSSCVVYPHPEGDPHLPIHTEYEAPDQTGQQTGTDDFIGFRHYRPGDSIRNIDWKILAREQGIMVKKFSGSGAKKLVLKWEQTAAAGSFESRLSQLTLWIILAESNGLRYGMEIPGHAVPVDNGASHRHHCLCILASYGK
jgi:uncharacterized protein (DUF58 family)